MKINYKLVSFSIIFPILLVACDSEKHPKSTEAEQSIVGLNDMKSGHVNPIMLEGELSDTFMLGSSYTDLQRENTYKKVVGTNVVWTLPIYEISLKDGVYKVLTKSGLMTGDANRKLLSATILISPQNDDDRKKMEAFKTDDLISFKGNVADIRLRSLVIVSPAILIDPAEPVANKSKVQKREDKYVVTPKKLLHWKEVGNSEQMGL